MKITLLKSYSDPNPVGYTTFASLIKKLLKDPAKLEEADSLLAATGDEYDKLKAKLPAFIIGEFSRRNEAGLTHFEPFFCFDIDHVPAERVDELFKKLSEWEHTYVLYPSPSGRGFRLFVRSNCTQDTRGIAYHIASNNLSIFSGIPLEEDLTPEQRKTDLVINTSTKDISRLWFYTGIRKFFRGKDHKPVLVPTQVANRTSKPQMDEDEKVEALVAEIEKNGVDITADYDSWMRAGMAIASTFGEGGRGYFHRISGYNNGYDYAKADKKYDNLVKSSKGRISIATLFKLAKDCGVTISYRPAHEAMYPSATWEDPGAERMVNAFCASKPDNYTDLIARVPYLKPACFKDEVQKAVFEVIESMAAQGKYIDPITVYERVESFSPETRSDTKLNIHLEAALGYADTVFSFYQKSEAARILLERSNEIAGGKNVTEVLSAMESQMTSIGMEEVEDDSIASAVKHSRKTRNELFVRMVNEESTLIGATTGLKKEDEFTGGRIPGTLVVMAARPGMGKCLGKGTKVLMFNGTLKNVEDVVPGDMLMGDDSTPRNVLSIARGSENMYWVHQNKGISYRVNESHILSLKRSRTHGMYKHGDVLNISVIDYINSSNKFKTNYKGYKVDVEFPFQQVQIDPYFLGLWLGDGSSDWPSITNEDQEVIDYLHSFAEQHNMVVSKYEYPLRTACYGIVSKKKFKSDGSNSMDRNKISSAFRDSNLLKNKHIPMEYICNSKDIRLSLLAGLIDSDGYYCQSANCFEIVQKREGLARQIKFLCDTLGFMTSMVKKSATIKSTGYSGDVYRVRISGNLDIVPVKIERKKARKGLSKRSWRHTGIKVEFDKFDDYYGFEIDGNHLFLLEDMTVTHNTAKILNEALAVAESAVPVGIVSVEMTKMELSKRLTAIKSGISNDKLKNPLLLDLEAGEDRIVEAAEDHISKLPIKVVDKVFSIRGIRAKIRQWASAGVKVVYIDYLGLIQSEGKDNETLRLQKITGELKRLAKELDICIVLLSQLSRAVETRGGSKRPILSDLRDSGAIEQDADIVIFLYRPEYYKIMSDEEGYSTEGMVELIYAKHRDGEVDTVIAGFEGDKFRFTDFTRKLKSPLSPVAPSPWLDDDGEENDIF